MKKLLVILAMVLLSTLSYGQIYDRVIIMDNNHEVQWANDLSQSVGNILKLEDKSIKVKVVYKSGEQAVLKFNHIRKHDKEGSIYNLDNQEDKGVVYISFQETFMVIHTSEYYYFFMYDEKVKQL